MKSIAPSTASASSARPPTPEFDAVDRVFFGALRAPERLTVSEWADRYRFLAGAASSEPGRYRTDRTPYAREIMDSLSPSSPVETVVVMAGSQVGKTEIGLNWVGETVHQTGGTMLIVWQSDIRARQNSRLRLKPLIDASPVLRARVRPARKRDSGNSTLSKEFPGGMLLVTGANTASGLVSTPCGKLLLDEIDQYPLDVDGQGDPVELAKVRTRTFAGSRKIYLCSSPTAEGRSRIAKEFAKGDQRRYHVPCPHCGHYQALRWDRLRYVDDDPETTLYFCVACDVGIEERAHKTAMLAAGRWVASNPDADPKVRSYHLSALYAPIPWYSWADCVAKFLAAKGDPALLQVWSNTDLGETWRVKGEAPDWEILYRRRESYALGTVPRRALILTAGVDVQRDRIEIEVVGWGRDFESWSIGYYVFPVDTEKRESWAPVWTLLGSTFPHEGGARMPIRRVAIDAGDRQNTVLSMTRGQPIDQVVCVKGFDRRPALVGVPIVVDIESNGRKIYRGAKLWPVGTSLAKGELYGWLRHERPIDEAKGFPRGYCHFPEHPEEYFRQLCAEEFVTRKKGRKIVQKWETTRERNEALDCRVYARAAAAMLGLDWMEPMHWTALEHALVLEPSPEPRHPGATPAAPAAPPKPDRAGDAPRERPADGGFWSRWQAGP